MTQRTALIAGATGAVSKRLVEHLSAGGWKIVGLCRNTPPDTASTRYLSVDLMDAGAVKARIRDERAITHLFYCSRASHGEGGVESVEENVAMLRHVLDATEAASEQLEHVHIVEGAKWYGLHLGPFPTPALEDDPRHMPPNFYYDQEDLVIARQQGKRWFWSASRPNVVCDFDPARPRNMVSIVGAYAAICAELGMALDYPGQPGHYHALTELTDAGLLARAMAFMATTPACRNQAYNVTNGDVFRWQQIWPLLADYYKLKVGPVRAMTLATWMADKGPLWQRIVARHKLAPRKLDDLALWSFADFVFRQSYDVMSSTSKLRLAGFAEMIDTRRMLFDQLDQYRRARLIP